MDKEELDQLIVNSVASAVKDWFGAIESDHVICDEITANLIGRQVLSEVGARVEEFYLRQK